MRMSKVVVSQFVSLDGVIEDPGGVEGFDRGGWAFRFDRGPEGNKFKLDEILASDALLLGRSTYQAFANTWPSMTDKVGFADKINQMPKFVVSTTMDDPGWNNATVISANVAEEVLKLKRDLDRDILVHGSGQLVADLIKHDLIDEYRLMVFPIVLGPGKRLFEDPIDGIALELVDMQPAGETLILTYTPAAP
jgi:dihydrofolate reductase